MSSHRHLFLISSADFIARASYQMGKTPLLPLFAVALGASDLYLGFIVSVSTLTGMVLKPLIGMLSDQSGRFRWLMIGTAFFIIMPFLYQFIETPEQLLVIRLIHGFATAIYGPVTVAYVIEQKQDELAERLGWFGLARSGGYIVGPTVAGALLTIMNPVDVFTIIGLLSSLTFAPLVLLPRPTKTKHKRKRKSFLAQCRQAWAVARHNQAIWFAGGIEILMFIATYSLKTFLPLYAVSAGVQSVRGGLLLFFARTRHHPTQTLCRTLG